MIKRTIEISQAPAHLAVKHGQLLLRREGETFASIPCEDIGVLVTDHPGVTYSHAALNRLAEEKAAVVLCGANHVPKAMLLPFSEHTEVVERLRVQMEVAKPVKKRIWQQIVQAKITAQAENLPKGSSGFRRLRRLSGKVLSGDSSNIEAQAARVYWKAWLDGEPFTRDQDGDGLNGILNYGYAVVRAAVARAIVSAGLHPGFGIHHHNRSNGFCLADDLMEPFRALVDRSARTLWRDGCRTVNPSVKRELLGLLSAEVRTGETTGPLMVCLHRMTASLIRCYRKEADILEIPVQCS